MSGTVRRWLRFEVAGNAFALPLESVVEVSEARGTYSIPFVAPEVGGVVNLRGEPLPAVDGARVLLGIPSAGLRTVLVLEDGDQRVGVRVDQVSRIEADDRFDLEPGEGESAAPVRWARAGGSRIGLCDAARLVARARGLLTGSDTPIQEIPQGG